MKTALLFLFFAPNVFSEDCSLDTSGSDSPFIINDQLKFPKYEANKINIPEEGLFYVSCPTGTQSPYISETGDHVGCKGGTKLLNLRTVKIIDFAEISCKRYPPTTAQKTEKCANDGTLYEIGFQIFTNFSSKITVCFDEKETAPFYVKYENFYYKQVAGRIQNTDDLYAKYICSGTGCSWDDTGKVYAGVSMDDVFAQQATILQNLGIADVGIELKKVPLTASNLIFMNEKYNGQQVAKTPYFDYMGVVPTWNSETTLNNLLYMFVLSAVNGDSVGQIMYTGSLGVLSLAGEDGDQVKVYLSDGQVPVPKWIWIVLDKSEKIVFYYNHPTPESEDLEKAISEVCSEHEPLLGSNIFVCQFDSVIDGKIKEFIDNDL